MSKAKAAGKPALGKNEKQERLMGYILAAPAVILLIAFTVYPLFYMFYRSLFSGSLLTKNPSFVGFENYSNLFGSDDFYQTLGNTLIYTLITVVFTMILATLIAVWLKGKRNSKLNDWVQTFIFTPHIISMVSVSTLFLWLMNTDSGLINVVIRALGGKGIPWLSSTDWALIAVSIVSIWKGLGYYSLLIMAALQNIPTTVYEAAEMDDTPKVKVFFKITLPMISPTILFTSVVAVIASFKVFDSISVMTGGGPLNSTNTLVYYIYQYAFQYSKPGQACAAAMILLIIVCLITVLQFQVSKSKVHYQ